MNFENRQGTNLNRRKLKIISQSANEIIADIERCDNVSSGNEGTRINASLFQTLQNQVINSNGTVVKLNGTSQSEVNFSSDPQTQINTINSTLNNKQNTLTFDASPTINSNNPVTSGGVFSAINNSTVSNITVYSATLNNPSNNVTLNGKAVVTTTGNYRFIDFYFYNFNISNLIHVDSTTTCLVETYIPSISASSISYLSSQITQTNVGVANGYMNTHSVQGGTMLSTATNDNYFAFQVSLRRAYNETNVCACLVIKIMEELSAS